VAPGDQKKRARLVFQGGANVGTSPREDDFLREKVQARQEYGIRFLGLGGSEHENVGGAFDPNDVPI